jgi:hypothetical protein
MKSWSGICKTLTKYGGLCLNSFSVVVCSIIDDLYIPLNSSKFNTVLYGLFIRDSFRLEIMIN